MNILLIRFGAIGDLVLASPAAMNLKIAYPDSNIMLLTKSFLVPLAQKIKGIDEVLEFPNHALFRDLFLMGEYLDKLGIDIIVDLHGNLRSQYLTKHINASIKMQYGKRRFERFAAVRFNKIRPDAPHTIDLYNDAVGRCGAEIYARRPILEVVANNEPLFDNSDLTVAIAPGASYPTKQWPSESFKRLALDLHKERNANIVLIITSAEREFMTLSDRIAPDKLKIFIDEPLENLPDIIAETSVLVANDSGMAHIGSSVGTPVVALFGPTHPTLGFSPRGLHDTIVEVDEYCRPCSLHGKRKCHRSERFCFNRISTADVSGVAGRILEKRGRREKALFIDRDGTLIVDKNYLFDPELVEPENGSLEAIKLAKSAGYKIIVITNQSGVARGYFDEPTVKLVNDRIAELFAEHGAPIDAFYYCPHYAKGTVAEYAIPCECRKPYPGMIENACRDFPIDLNRSFVIGDKLSDINLAHVVGAKSCLVRTGYGAESENNILPDSKLYPDLIADNLLDFVKSLIE